MNRTTRRAYALILVIIMFIAGMIYLIYSFFAYGALWSSNKANQHIFSSGQITTAGTIYDTNGTVLAQTVDGERVYNSSKVIRKSTLHIVGDTSGIISTGVHSVFRSKLSGYSFINGIYPLIKHGKGNNLTLSIDADACATALNALGGFKGTVAVYNYKTGALLCDVSLPTYDINNIPSDILTNKKYEGVYLNRFFSGLYTPGSTFKIITAICAVQNIPDIESQTFVCKGSSTINGGKLVCMKTHGEVTFEEALNKSCNCAFGDIAIQLGADKLNETAAQLGFNTYIKADGINLAMSQFHAPSDDKLELAWAGVGQSDTLVNPCHLLMIAGAIANGGRGALPYVVKEMTNQTDITIYKAITKNSPIVIDAAVAAKLKTLLRSDVKNQYGDWSFPDLQMCGKTGTAEINGEKSHSWFVGFSMRSDFPLAVVVIAENAGSGSGVALSAANAVLQSIVN